MTDSSVDDKSRMSVNLITFPLLLLKLSSENTESLAMKILELKLADSSMKP